VSLDNRRELIEEEVEQASALGAYPSRAGAMEI